MKNYYSVEDRLYVLTAKQKKQLDKTYGIYNPLRNEEDLKAHEDRLKWIEDNGKYMGPCENSAY